MRQRRDASYQAQDGCDAPTVNLGLGDSVEGGAPTRAARLAIASGRRDIRTMSEFRIQVEAKARRASKRPKSVVAKTLSTTTGVKTRVNSVDANSATFGADFLYVFKSNVRKARRGAKNGHD
jgi:hypothetical protein